MTLRTDDLRRAADPHSAVSLPAIVQQAGSGETAIAAMAAKAQALVHARYEVAFHRPRDLDRVRQMLMKECTRPTFAKVAEYNKPVGKGIKGPSIRFAETAIRCMTNIVIDTTTVYDDQWKRIVNVSVTDLESNVPYAMDVTIEKSVERNSKKDDDIVVRERTGSTGKKVYIIVATDEDILNKQNALISKAIRTQGLRLVPGDFIDEGMRIAREVRATDDARDPDAAKRAIYDAFGDLGVQVEQLKDYLGHDGSTLVPAELETLRGLYAALRDNETTWREIMDNRTPPKPPKPKEPQQPEQKKQPTQVEQAKGEPQPTDAQMAAWRTEKERQQAELAAAERVTQNKQPLNAQAHAGDGDGAKAEATPPQPKTVEQEFAGAGDGRITFNEIVMKIREATSLEFIDSSVIPMIPEIPNDRHRTTLENMAKNKKEWLVEQAKEKAAAAAQPQQTKPPTAQQQAATTARARRNVDMD